MGREFSIDEYGNPPYSYSHGMHARRGN